MTTKNRDIRIESVLEENYREQAQDNFDEIQKVLNEGMVILEELIKFVRTLKKFEDRDQVKEQEIIGKVSEGSDIPPSTGCETQIGEAG
jgi:hypothetical protein